MHKYNVFVSFLSITANGMRLTVYCVKYELVALVNFTVY